jgi:hypothetical protein
MKKWWKNFINSDASINVFIVLMFVVTFAVVYFGMSYENGKQTANGEKVHYSHPIKDRAHGGVGFGFGYSPRTHRFGYGFGTGVINFH